MPIPQAYVLPVIGETRALVKLLVDYSSNKVLG